ncbi:serine/threonine-protein kinase [Actinomadura nitritigenes]|uniref:serine/threonine-protein kinase n=1 Tax=Actinomadura nitritigenes TaxID=134602 RepID=UPI003D89CAC9
MRTMLAGRYRLSEPLGRGGMGTVWKARDEVLGRDVAVKELLAPPHLDAQARDEANARALREARAAARLDHPAIIKVHDVVEADDRPWIVMELLTGRSLDAVLKDGPLPPGRAARIGLAVLDALRAAHAQGVLHRDVKPANVFDCDDGRIVLTDFGIASVAGDISLTRPGALVGSPAYMAPERVRGTADGPAADLWALGATLYALVEGRTPFDRRTAMGTLSAVLSEEPALPRRAGPLAPALLALLAKNPADRPAPAALAAMLEAVADGREPSPPTARLHRPPRPAGTRAFLAAGAALALAAIAVVAVVYWRGIGRGDGDGGSPGAPLSTFPPACSLLADDQVRSLYGPMELGESDAGECEWSTVDFDSPTVHLAIALTLDAAIPAGTGWSHDHLVSISASANEESTSPRPVTGLAEEAIAFDEAPSGRTSTVVFRERNLSVVVTVQYSGTVPSWRAQDTNVLQAARWADQTLRRTLPNR